jgi:hypothetical protein
MSPFDTQTQQPHSPLIGLIAVSSDQGASILKKYHRKFPQLRAEIQSAYSNPTPPDRYYELRRLQEEDRLHYGSVDVADERYPYSLLRYPSGNFGLRVMENLQVVFKAVFDSAAWHRRPFGHDGKPVSPLLRQVSDLLKDGETLKTKDGALRSHFDRGRIHYLGPYLTPQKWGVETSRPYIQQTLDRILEFARV